MKCPHSPPGEPHELAIPDSVESNVMTYQKSATTVTDCCGKMVRVRSFTRYEVSRSSHLDQLKEDDWGRKPWAPDHGAAL